MAEKKFVIKRIEGTNVVFESEGQTVRVPLKEIETERKRLENSGKQPPAIELGLKVIVGDPDGCHCFWKTDECTLAFKHDPG